jgi:archaellum component FlaC
MKVEYNRTMEILTVVLGLFAVSFAIAYISLLSKTKEMTKAFFDVLISKKELEEAYNNYASIKNSLNETDIHTKNFIKFLSDSRDWAFEYIENVQNGIKKFMNEVSPQIEYFNKQDSSTNTNLEISEFTLKKISKEIEELKKFLPEENSDRR